MFWQTSFLIGALFLSCYFRGDFFPLSFSFSFSASKPEMRTSLQSKTNMLNNIFPHALRSQSFVLSCLSSYFLSLFLLSFFLSSYFFTAVSFFLLSFFLLSFFLLSFLSFFLSSYFLSLLSFTSLLL